MARRNRSHGAQGYEVLNLTYPSVDEEDEDSVVTIPSTPPVRRSSANVDSTSERVFVLIDNLELDVQAADLLKQLQQFCDIQKIQFVIIVRQYPGMNHALGNVAFKDRESAEAAVGDLANCVIVSSRGRPWVVTLAKPRWQSCGKFYKDVSECFQNPAPSSLSAMPVHADHKEAGPSAVAFKVLKTSEQPSEHKAAQERQRVFKEHRNQIILTMFQMQAREYQKAANPHQNACSDGRVLVMPATTRGAVSALKFIMLNAAKHVAEVLNHARAVVLAGGTLQPVEEVRVRLLPHLPEDRVHIFGCGHIVPPESIHPLGIARGPSNQFFYLTYQSRSSKAIMEELGRLINNISVIANGGPPPALLRLLRQILVIFLHPLSYESFYGHEDPELLERMCYIGHLDKSCFGLGRSGQKGREYYENLCMKAVNQSIGRALRHIGDYAAILLVDVRYTNGSSFSGGGAGARMKSGHASKLHGWIKDRFQITDRFGEVHKQLHQFFQYK
ncbi:unnamed protein product [Calypogeia fissa]